MSWTYNRDKLPSPEAYLSGEAIDFKVRGQWATMLCPFHDDSTPSMRMNVEDGHYKCMSCETKGGDLVDFHMARTGLTFVFAATYLGAFDGDANSESTKIHMDTPLDKTLEALRRLLPVLDRLRASTFNAKMSRKIEEFEAARLDFLGELLDPTGGA